MNDAARAEAASTPAGSTPRSNRYEDSLTRPSLRGVRRTVTHRLLKPQTLYIIEYMKSLLIELDDDVAARLERVAPGRARRRSEFIRLAIRRALWDIEERATADAYRRVPDSAADAHVDPTVWEPRAEGRRRRDRS